MARNVPSQFPGALDIARYAAHDDGPDIIRVRVTDGSAAGRLIQFEMSINDFARAVMGTSHVPVLVDDVPMRRGPTQNAQVQG
jgi:hypothetical protein